MAVPMVLSESPVVEKVGSYASCNLQAEWERCCAKAMGGVDNDVSSLASPPPQCVPTIHILNLMDDNNTTKAITNNTTMIQYSNNHWMQNAHEIATSIEQMASMVKRNARGYVTNDLSQDEASVLESTVLSFSATAANQIDTLGSAIIITTGNNVKEEEHFQHGVVQSLMQSLQDTVANPMALLQKQRTRMAMTIYQQPLACRLEVFNGGNNENDGNVWDQLVDGNDDTNRQEGQQFVPQHAAPSMSTDFIVMYAQNDDESLLLSKPTSLFSKKHSYESDDDTKQPPTKQGKFSHDKQERIHQERMNLHQHQLHQHDEQEYQRHHQEEMQQEALLLEAQLNSDLDSVFQVEQRMTDITTLLSQFSVLVNQQQEEVVAIYDTTLSSKDNVAKGQESLVDAKERTKKSKHRMATLVWIIAMILLFFNYIVP